MERQERLKDRQSVLPLCEFKECRYHGWVERGASNKRAASQKFYEDGIEQIKKQKKMKKNEKETKASQYISIKEKKDEKTKEKNCTKGRSGGDAVGIRWRGIRLKEPS